MGWFTNRKISTKLISSFVVVALIAGVVGIVGIMNISKIEKSDTELYENMTVPIDLASDMGINFQSMQIDIRDMILEDNHAAVEEEYEAVLATIEKINVLAEEFERRMISDEINEAFQAYVGTRLAFDEGLEEIHRLALEDRFEDALQLLNGEMDVAADAQEVALQKLIDIKVNDAEAKAEQNKITAQDSRVIMIAIIIGGMLLAVALGYFIARMISRPLQQIVNAAGQIADGDLNVQLDIKSKDEVGTLAQAFSRMADNINEVMTNINTSADEVATGSKQVSESGVALSQGATEQASSIEQLTASMEEIASQTTQNASNADQANRVALDAKADAEKGNSQMKEMLVAMSDINESSGNISKIIKVIDEIAFLTNILALNAAVEAARAGQHGKGFAVVAEEVRNLAARSANAAKETTAMIEGSIQKVEGGTKIANDTADALNKIVGGVGRVAELVNQIATASNEQAAGIAQVNQGIMQVSQVTQTNSATSEESAAASEELSSQAAMLKEQVSRFTLRKARASAYRGEEMSPDVLRMLESMSSKKKAPGMAEYHAEAAPAKASGKSKIALSDKEFGKY